MSATSFVDLVQSPEFQRQQRETREREEREQAERGVRRGGHEPANMTRQERARAMIADGRSDFGFDHEVERQRRSNGGGKVPKKGERHVGR